MKTAYIPCPNCSGYGQVWTGEDVDWCRECDGNSTIRARDDKGRFTTVEINGKALDKYGCFIEVEYNENG